MRLYLALAVLMLALVAYTDAQEPSVQERFAEFGEKVSEIGRNIADRTKTAFEDLHNSEAAVKTRNWFKQKFGDLRQHFEQN